MERGPGIGPGRANIGTFLDNVQGRQASFSVVIPSNHGRRVNAGFSPAVSLVFCEASQKSGKETVCLVFLKSHRIPKPFCDKGRSKNFIASGNDSREVYG